MFSYNDPHLKSLRRSLRVNQTDTEKLLWSRLRSKQLGVKFFRQYSTGSYILDFYCPQKRLAVELDGGQHNEEKQQKHDEERTEYLAKQNITVLRFWNNEVIESFAAVLQVIHEKINNA